MSTQTASNRSTSRTPVMSTAARRSIAVVAGLLGLVSIYAGSQLLVSGIAHYQASAFIQDWEKKGSAPTEQAWQVAHDAIQHAISSYPAANGEYLETLGYIQQWQAFGTPLDSAVAKPSREAAAQALRQATQARPTWPDAWAALAYAKLHLLSFDDELTHAMQQAQHFGPWRIGINRRIAEIGLIAFPVLNSEQRTIVSESIQRTAQYSTKERKQLFELAAQTNSLTVLCNALDDAPETPCTPTPQTP